MASVLDLPPDMPADMKAKLHCDVAETGNAFYRRGDDGRYERIAPILMRWCGGCWDYHEGAS